MNDLPAIQDLIRKAHGCESLHVQAVPVTEKFKDGRVWTGAVEVFELLSHPKARRCYALGLEQDGKRRYLTVLKSPPVDSPQKAVQLLVGEPTPPASR